MDVALLQRFADQGYTRKEIANITGLPLSTINNSCTKHGIKTKRPDMTGKRPLKDSVKKILELREKGMSYREIAKTLNIPFHRVAKACQNHGAGKAIIEQRLTESQVVDYISRSGFDYIDGFITARSSVRVRCRKCGGVFERNFHIFRDVANGTWKSENECPLCKEKQKEERVKEKEHEARIKAEQRVIQAQEIARTRAREKADLISRQTEERLAIRVCKNCGKEYCIEVTGYNSKQYCSELCSKRWNMRIKRDRRVRHMRKREHDSDITLEKLFDRDKGICKLCGKLCDWNDDGNGPNYPSIDHIVPIVKGGKHVWSNIQLAHRRCNWVKGDKDISYIP